MRGRASFGLNELHAIEHTLAEMMRCEDERRRRLQDMLRRQYRFYVSDFTRSGTRLTSDEFERLIAQGVIAAH